MLKGRNNGVETGVVDEYSKLHMAFKTCKSINIYSKASVMSVGKTGVNPLWCMGSTYTLPTVSITIHQSGITL